MLLDEFDPNPLLFFIQICCHWIQIDDGLAETTPILSHRFVLVKSRLNGAGYYIYVGVGIFNGGHFPWAILDLKFYLNRKKRPKMDKKGWISVEFGWIWAGYIRMSLEYSLDPAGEPEMACFMEFSDYF